MSSDPPRSGEMLQKEADLFREPIESLPDPCMRDRKPPAATPPGDGAPAEPEVAPFQIPFGDRRLQGDIFGPALPDIALVLHGAGQHHRGKMRPLRLELLERGLGTSAVDLIGHGETGGALLGSSLAERSRQVRAVIDGLGLADRGPLAILAASMGAHTAVDLVADYEVDRLVLVVPAMYGSAAHAVPFGDEFTAAIRRPDSWKDSIGWERLATFRGELLIIAGADDKVIPRGVIERYERGAPRARRSHLELVPKAGHLLFTELRQRHPEAVPPLVDAIADGLRQR